MIRTMRVFGIPQSKGSTRSFNRGGRIVTTSTNRNLRDWSLLVASEAQRQVGSATPMKGPVWVQVEFILPRPKSVKRSRPSVKPDLDKLVRAVLDPLIGIWFVDDAQVVVINAAKRYGDQPLVDITAKEIE